MNFVSAPPRPSRKRIITYVMLNLLATPGLGSLLARRWFEGIGQTVLSLVGFLLIMDWFYELVFVQYYGLATGNVVVRPVGYLGLTGTVVFVIAWLWTLVTSVALLRQASSVGAESLKLFGASLIKLDETRLPAALATVPHWQRQGAVIARTYEFKDFRSAMKFVNAIAAFAEQVQHHPDIDVRRNRVTLSLSTHDAGGLTAKDFALARECDACATSDDQ